MQILAGVYQRMGTVSTALFFSWAALLVVLIFPVRRRLHKATVFDLAMLAGVSPLVIFGMLLVKNFWPHYLQFLLPFISIGAMSLFVLLHHQRWLRFLFRQRALALLLALACVSPWATEMRMRPDLMAPAAQNLRALLERHGLASGDFLAPYNQYVHVRLNQRRHGFPNAIVSVDSTLKGWYSTMDVPTQFRIPTNSRQYCQMLDDQGPKLIVFFAYTIFWGTSVPPTHLANCQLRQYDLHNLSGSVRQPSDIAFYFLRR